MDKRNFYFYISGFISLSFFLLVCAAFVLVVIVSKKPDTFALKKDNYISVSIEMPKIQKSVSKKDMDTPIEEKRQPDKPPLEERAPQETVVKTQKKEINIDNLFSNVWTKSIEKKAPDVKKKEIDKRVIDEIQKKIAKSDAAKSESVIKKIQSIDARQVEDENAKSSTAMEVNEYLAKIQALVYEHFYPPKNSEGNSVVAVIELSSMGKVMDFRILSYSDNEALNSECDKIKTRLEGILFPKNPEKSSGTYKITLISER